jgi:hypothetical protein
LEDLSGKMQVAIDKFALANGYAVILDVSNQNGNVLYVASGVDITKDIIDLYDKTNPTAPGSATPTTKPAAPATRPAPPAATPQTPPVKKQP